MTICIFKSLLRRCERRLGETDQTDYSAPILASSHDLAATREICSCFFDPAGLSIYVAQTLASTNL